jgi:integral membrane sensor domain MASE1
MLGVAAIYFVAAKLGLSMAVTAEQVSAVWPPTGIALAAILIFGYRIWPGILLGAFIANATANESVGTACAIALGNTLEAVVGAWLLLQWVGFDKSLERIKDVVGLVVVGACLSTTLSATIGVVSLCAAGLQPWSNFASLWIVWWLGDAMGNLVVAPLLLTIVRPLPAASLRRGIEGTALTLGLVAVGLSVFNFPTPADYAHYPLVYTIFPLVIWAALRFGQLGTTAVTCIASVFAIWGTLHGVGPFGSGPMEDRLISLQAFLGIVATTGLFLGAALAERRRDGELRSVLHAVTQILAESTTLAEATPKIVRRICTSLTWQMGAIWQVNHDSEALTCAGVWCAESTTLPAFERATIERSFEKGIGLPGRVWESGEHCHRRDGRAVHAVLEPGDDEDSAKQDKSD